MLLQHLLAEEAAHKGANQNCQHADHKAAAVDGCKQRVDVGGVLAAGCQVGYVGGFHEPQRQNRAGQAIGKHDVASQQQLFAAVFASSGHQVCRDAADDVGRERQHKMAGDEEEQAHHKTHDRDAAEFLQLGGQQHIDAAGDQRGHGGQQNVAHARQQYTGEGRHGDKHKVQRGKDADRDQVGHGQLVGLLVHGDSS